MRQMLRRWYPFKIKVVVGIFLLTTYINWRLWNVDRESIFGTYLLGYGLIETIVDSYEEWRGIPGGSHPAGNQYAYVSPFSAETCCRLLQNEERRKCGRYLFQWDDAAQVGEMTVYSVEEFFPTTAAIRNVYEVHLEPQENGCVIRLKFLRNLSFPRHPDKPTIKSVWVDEIFKGKLNAVPKYPHRAPPPKPAKKK